MTEATAFGTRDNLSIRRRLRVEGAERQALRAIFEGSFPPEEREDFDAVMAGVDGGNPWLFTAHLGEELAGFACGLPLTGPGIQLLGYLAMAPEYRSQGLGAALLRLLAENLRAREGAKELLLEVESDEAGPPEERALRRRRIGWYRRNGVRRLEGVPPLRMPSMADDGVVETKLMWLPLREGAAEPVGERLRACLVALFTEGYHTPPDHPLLREALRRTGLE